MAKGFKTGGKDFEVGHPGMGGRPKLPEELKAARAMNNVRFEEILNRFLHMKPDELVKVLQDPNTTLTEIMVGKIVSECIRKGDQSRLAFLLERILGKVPDKISIEGSFHSMLVEFINKKVDDSSEGE